VPMDFYWRDLLYIAERVFLQPLPFFKYFLPQEYLDLQNHYAGDSADLRIWRGTGSVHPELLEFMEKGETGKLPRLFHHLWHDRINMEFAEECMRSMLWHRGLYVPTNQFDPYLDSDEYKANADSPEGPFTTTSKSTAKPTKSSPNLRVSHGCMKQRYLTWKLYFTALRRSEEPNLTTRKLGKFPTIKKTSTTECCMQTNSP